MLFKTLKLFGLDVPAKIEAAKASLERRIEQATDHVKEVAQEAAVIAAVSVIALITAVMTVVVGLIALYFWVANTYGMFAGFGVVGGILLIVTIALAATAAVKARSMASAGTRSERYAAAPVIASADPDMIESAAIAEAAASHSHSEPLAGVAPRVTVHVTPPASERTERSSARDLIDPLTYLLPKVMRFPTMGNPAVDELIGNLAVTARGTADEAVDRAATVIRQGSRANLVLVLTGAGMVGFMLARHSRR
jgi:uncharacterized membrane protein